MTYRLAAICFIFVCTAFAWWILGASLYGRTSSADARLKGTVISSWGEAQVACPPSALFDEPRPAPPPPRSAAVPYLQPPIPPSPPSAPEAPQPPGLELVSTRAAVDLLLDQRQKGLLWYSTYAVHFASTYGFTNETGSDRDVRFRLPLPAQKALYDDLALTLDGVPLVTGSDPSGIFAKATIPARKTVQLGVRYRSQGLGTWTYRPGGGRPQVKDFELKMHTDFARIDVPGDGLSPTSKTPRGKGWDLTWSYRNLVSGSVIGMVMPEKLQPGPVAARISFFAPVSLLFFFFLIFLLTTMRGVDLHPMNYFFLAAAFFAFHLLLAYLVDLISIHLAFAICSAVSVFLVVSYLRLVVGMRFALVEAGVLQLVYLVAFSYAFFLEGMTGLAITIGAILTLFLVMQWTGRMRWSDVFAGKGAVRAAGTIS
jgi:hypothetical protein